MQSHERVKPLAPAEWSDLARERLAATAGPVAEMEGDQAHAEGGDSSGTLNILRTIAHHPKLLGPFLDFAGALALDTLLTRRVSELLALRVIWHCQSAFEWGHHVVFARAAGMSDEEIARIAQGADAPGWSEEERLLLRATDELYARQDLSEETWLGLRERFSDAQLVEIPFVVGQYAMLSMVANATGVPVEGGLEPMPPKP